MTATIAGLDLVALQRFFETNVPDLAGPLEASLMAGGKSNLTYRLGDGVHDWVLRRPPLGPLTPTAHDMSREFRIVKALNQTDVPAAEAVVLCEDESVIGVPFAVVAFVAGRSLQDGNDTEKLTTAEARDCSLALVDALAQLHAVPYAEVGLGEFGRPAGYLGRQVKRWRGQWDRVATRELDTLDQLREALEKAMPEQSGSTIVHGDYRLDNTIIDPTDFGRIAAIVDWEMATLGDPLADVGLLQVYWDPSSEPVLGVRHAPSANPGFLSGDEIADRYAAVTGRSLDNLAFYRALGYFKLAVIAEGIHQRFLAGKTIGSGFDTLGSAVPLLLDRGLETLA
ncbi:phosphotransferase family protein [Smaragdicoccus niigatensis]|uniref:phosphotransferase family protein n=1 Tax=Smaragdicoccus niigatensis TaxID=359359 RepID=UPI000367F462|nr:phosphotransferase family protein [Smaragdicoccus niigatensis]